MNKIFRITWVIGVMLLVLAGFFAYKTHSFESTALHAVGKITDLRYSKSNDSSAVWYPEVTFIDDNGETVTFESSVGSSSYRNSLGDIVEVLYQSDDVKNAKINDMTGLYLGPIICAIFGFALLFFGTLLSYLFNKGSKHSKLMQSGKPLTAKVLGVELNESLNINGRSPWRIVCQWLDPQTNQVHVFNSGNFFYDPAPFISDENITVYVAHDNYKKYYVDTSKFPKKA